jgi:dUTP pyrophosphatase
MAKKKTTMNIVFANKSDNPNPEYKHAGDSGFDLRAYILMDEDTGKREITIKPLERMLIHTGLYFELAHGTELQVRPRSGHAIKYGLTVINTPGTVDSQYRGEVCVLLINLSLQDQVIENGDRIAQGVICPVFTKEDCEFTQVDDVSTDTERGTGGFNSTGTK